MTITSNTESAESLKAVLVSRGFAPDEPAQPAEAAPVQPVKTGEEAPAPGGETAPVSETGEPKKQGTQATETTPVGTETEHPSRKKFQAQKEQLRRQVERLTEDLDTERGSKAKLNSELAELRQRLQALEAPSEKKSDGPVMPKLPKRAEFDYDDDKYEEALTKYHDDLATYYKAENAKSVADAIAQKEQQDQERIARAKADEIFNRFVERRDAGVAELPDYEDYQMAAPEIELPPEIQEAIIQSDLPAHLMHHFFKDSVDNKGADLARIMALTPLVRIRELTKLEVKLANERDGKKKPAATAPAVVDEKPVEKPVAAETPVKPRATAPPVPEAPIEPLGGRTSARAPGLADAADTKRDIKAYIALRNQGISR